MTPVVALYDIIKSHIRPGWAVLYWFDGPTQQHIIEFGPQSEPDMIRVEVLERDLVADPAGVRAALVGLGGTVARALEEE